MSPKLAILFMLIGVIIGLSHVNDENTARMNSPVQWSTFAQSIIMLLVHRANAAFGFKRLRSASHSSRANLRTKFFD